MLRALLWSLPGDGIFRLVAARSYTATGVKRLGCWCGMTVTASSIYPKREILHQPQSLTLENRFVGAFGTENRSRYQRTPVDSCGWPQTVSLRPAQAFPLLSHLARSIISWVLDNEGLRLSVSMKSKALLYDRIRNGEAHSDDP